MKNNSNKGIQNNKHYLSRSVRWIVFIFIVGIGGYLTLPSNYYLRRALTHLLPKIDQYPIFENRVVKAGSPRPWELSEAYNTKSIPERYLPRFEELGTVAYVIIQDNRLLFEQYWEDYSPESHSNSFSMAKSIVSLAIGCAIDDGFIRDVDQPVSDFFPEFKGYDGKALTLRHLLTMSAGVDFDEAYNSPFSPTTQLYYGDDPTGNCLRDERDRRARRKLYLPKRRDTTAGLYRGEGYRRETQRLCIPQTMDSDARRGKRPLEPRPEGRHGKSLLLFQQ